MKRKTPNSLYAVILAGGSGERLWPASRVKCPKYIMKIAGPKPILQATINRLKGLVPSKNIISVTTQDQVDSIKNNLKNVTPRNFLIEPYPRNTAAAIGLAAIHIKRKDPSATMVVLPADHYIKDTKSFRSCVSNAVNVAQKGYLVTVAIKPTFAATGYGYIKIKTQNAKRKTQNKPLYYKIEKFVEKPDRKTAKKFLKSNRFFWNAGIFVWKLEPILNSIKEYMPALYSALLRIDKIIGSRNFRKEISKIYRGLKKISIDYGIMEKAKNRAVVLAKFDWTDFGSWLSLGNIYKYDKNKNIFKALNVSYDTKGSIIFGSKNHLIATWGVKNLVIAHTKDATLIADKDKIHGLKQLVALIQKKGYKKYL